VGGLHIVQANQQVTILVPASSALAKYWVVWLANLRPDPMDQSKNKGAIVGIKFLS
jgi:hypothetical protein